MKTPLKVSSMMVILNAALNLAAVFGLPVEWRHVGLAGSTVLCAGISCAWLAAIARRRNGSLGWGRLVRPVAGILAASFAMGGVLVVLRPHVSNLPSVAALAILIAAGAAVYFSISFTHALFIRRRR